MKIGLLGDLHLTNRSPERRKDNYFETLLRKLDQAFSIFKKASCDCVIQVGDFFDAPTVANRVKSSVISLLKKHKKKVYCVVGQHDITGHSLQTLNNSPLAVLEASGDVTIVRRAEVIGDVSDKDSTAVVVYGASFGEEVPEPYEDSYNILITHRMIGDRPLYPGQELMSPKRFLKKYPDYNLVVAGDYHYRFIEMWNGRTIVNPGALVRKTISKFDLEHNPGVVIFDTATSTVKTVLLDVSPVEEVFDLSKKQEQKNTDLLLQFIESLKDRSSAEQEGWKHILLKVLEERNCSEEVKEVINECLEEISNG